jgi:SAM-dependent methyltransferase
MQCVFGVFEPFRSLTTDKVFHKVWKNLQTNNREGLSMRLWAKNILSKCGFEIKRVSLTEFEIEGLTYCGNPNSVGEEIYGEPTARGAVDMIRERDLKDLKILDIGCGLGVIGLTVYKLLQAEGRVKEVSFADINIFNLDSLKKSLRRNNFGELTGKIFHVFLSDALEQIPIEKKFDLILSNPPDWPSDTPFGDDNIPLTPKRLAVFDGAWEFHRAFYAKVDKHLTDRGEVWFLENGSVLKKNNISDFIKANPNLEYVGDIPYTGSVRGNLRGNLFWMIVRKKRPV